MNEMTTATVLHVDSVARVCRVSGMSSVDIEVPLSQSLTQFDLPVNGEKWGAFVTKGTQPMIVGFYPLSTISEGTNIEKSIDSKGTIKDLAESLFGEEFTYRSFRSLKTKNYRYNRYYDLISGDIGSRGFDGNRQAVLRGGVNVFGVSQICQIIQFALENTTRVVSDKLQLWTGAGILEFNVNEDSSRLDLKLNNSASKIKEEKYNVELSIGDCPGNNILTFKYITDKNTALVLGIDRTGRVIFETPTDVITRKRSDIEAVVNNKAIIAGDKIVTETKLTDITSSESTTLNAPKVYAGGQSNSRPVIMSPHLDKYKELLDIVKSVLITATSLNPSHALDIAKIELQKPLVDNDKTTHLEAK